MIQNNELRIGNLLLFENKTLNAATIGTEFCMLSDGTETYDVWYDDLHPVPLTEELILKCGFVKADCFYYTYRCPFTLWYDNFNDGSYNALSGTNHIAREIKYLHQLQNLHFAVTGRELEITNL